MRGSKYVQSCIGNTYKQAENFLREGRLVLFSGTPCQIEGLLAYLKKPYENLITQDLICHGVPSPMVWQKYIEYRRFKANQVKPKKISFRNKKDGWRRYSVSFLFENDAEYQTTAAQDPMMQIFLKNLCLRPSCYDCHFKTQVRRSDITLADFWGIERISPQMDDDKGTSLVVLQSKKGEELFKKIAHLLVLTETDVNVALSYNSAMIKSASIPSNRKVFFADILEKSFSSCHKKYCKKTLRARIKSLASKCIKIIRKK